MSTKVVATSAFAAFDASFAAVNAWRSAVIRARRSANADCIVRAARDRLSRKCRNCRNRATFSFARRLWRFFFLLSLIALIETPSAAVDKRIIDI